MGTINTILDKVVPRVQARDHEGKPLIDIIKEELEKEKSHSATDQSMQNDHNKIINNILTSKYDIDNGQIYKPNTNEVIGDIEEVLK